MLFAGLYESWYPERSKPEVTFTSVTCAANAVIGEIHDRMPVILDERAAEDWINPLRGGPVLAKTAARAGAFGAARDAAPLVARKQREKRGSRAPQAVGRILSRPIDEARARRARLD